jgi:hypothetical protein
MSRQKLEEVHFLMGYSRVALRVVPMIGMMVDRHDGGCAVQS